MNEYISSFTTGFGSVIRRALAVYKGLVNGKKLECLQSVLHHNRSPRESNAARKLLHLQAALFCYFFFFASGYGCGSSVSPKM